MTLIMHYIGICLPSSASHASSMERLQLEGSSTTFLSSKIVFMQ